MLVTFNFIYQLAVPFPPPNGFFEKDYRIIDCYRMEVLHSHFMFVFVLVYNLWAFWLHVYNAGCIDCVENACFIY